MEQQQTDEKFMRLALNEAEKALEEQEVPIGAVVVADGRIVGRGHNLVETLADATAHAEMQALTAAASTVGGKYLSECTLYVTVEPCIMCAGAIAWSQVGRVVYGADDPKRGYRRSSDRRRHRPPAPNDGDAGGIGRGVREARPFVLRRVEKVIFGKCRKKTKFAFPAFRREFRRMVATYRTGRYFRWVCREW